MENNNLKILQNDSAKDSLFKPEAQSLKTSDFEKEAELYKTIVENTQDAIYIYSGTKFLFVNSRLCEYFGGTREEIMAKNILDLVHPDDKPRIMENISKRMKGEVAPDSYEANMIIKNGEVRTYLFRIKVIDFRGSKAVLGIAKDITDRVNFQKKLIKSEQQFRGLLESINMISIIVDEKGIVSFCNNYFLKEFGYLQEEVIGQNWDTTFVCENENQNNFLFEKTEENSETSVFENLIRAKDGSCRLIKWNRTEIKDAENEKVTGIASIGMDITTHRFFEKERSITLKLYQITTRQSSKNELISNLLPFFIEISGCSSVGIRLKENLNYPYFEILNTSSELIKKEDGFCCCDNKGNPLSDEFGNSHLSCLCKKIIEGDIDTSKPFHTNYGSFWTNSYSKLTQELSPDEMPSGFMRKCIKYGYDSIALIPLKIQNQTFGLIQLNNPPKNYFNILIIRLYERLSHNIAIALAQRQSQEELIESESNYRILFEAMVQGVVYYDSEGVISSVNPICLEILGISESEVIGKSILTLNLDIINETGEPLKSEDFPAFKSLNTGEKVSNFILGVFNKQRQQYKWLNVSSTPIFKPFESKPFKVFSTLEDITSSIEFQKKIQSSLKEKEILLKEIYHRVKNNLQIISSLLNLQAAGIEDTRIGDILLDSQNRIMAMALIHERLYRSNDFSKLDFGAFAMELVNSLFASYNLNDNKVKLVSHFEEVSLKIDNAVACGLIINEILSNCLKHAFPDNREGTVWFELIQNNNMRIIRVKDDGVGLPQDFVISKATSLGMTLINALTEQLDGKISIKNNNGTIIEIVF